MGKTNNSNQTSLSYAEEASLKVLPSNLGVSTAVWYPLEPNSYSKFGATIKTTPREPINATRQRKKGSVTDLDAEATFNHDFTQNNLLRLMQGFLFASAHQKPTTQPLNGALVPVTAAVSGSPDQFTAASGLGTFLTNAIVKSSGFTTPANNRVNLVTAAASGALSVSSYNADATTSAIVAEAAPPATAQLETVGFALHGDVKLYPPGSTFGGATVVQPLLSSAANVDFTTLGLIPGEWVYLGDLTDDLTDTSASEFNFIGTGGKRNRGFCRIAPNGVTATALVFDLAIGSASWVLSGSGDGSLSVGTSGTVSLYFGNVIRNEPLPADIVRRTYTLQRYLGKNASNTDMLEYIPGAVPNQVTLNLPSNSKLAVDLSFVGMDTLTQYAANMGGTIKTGPIGETAFNTSQDVYAMLLYKVDSTTADQAPLFGFATDEKLSINNQTKADKAIGVIGGFDATSGNFEVTGSLTVYFGDIAAQKAVRDNSDVGLVNIFAKENAGMILDTPLLTLAMDGNKVEKDKPIMADVTQSASEGTLGYTLLYNHFPYLPGSAMASYTE